MRERYRIITPENVEFQYELAGFFSRFLAWFVDLLVIIGVALVLGFLVSQLSPFLGKFASALYTVAFFVVNWGYFIFFEWFWSGQSLGKRAVGLRVLSDEGVRITFMQSVVRNLFRVLDNLPLFYLLGGGVAFFSRTGKRLGDMAAGTVVVRERTRPVPESVVPEAERHTPMFGDREVVKRVQTRLGLKERELLLNLALRREQLPLDRRLVLYEGLSRHLEERLGLERPGHLSHEKFCLSVAAVLLRGTGVGSERFGGRRGGR